MKRSLLQHFLWRRAGAIKGLWLKVKCSALWGKCWIGFLSGSFLIIASWRGSVTQCNFLLSKAQRPLGEKAANKIPSGILPRRYARKHSQPAVPQLAHTQDSLFQFHRIYFPIQPELEAKRCPCPNSKQSRNGWEQCLHALSLGCSSVTPTLFLPVFLANCAGIPTVFNTSRPFS